MHPFSKREGAFYFSISFSCKSTEVPFRHIFPIRAYINDKNTGAMGRMTEGWEIAEGQHLKCVSVATIRCENKSIDGPCTLKPDYSWKRSIEGERIFLVRGKDKGRPAWHYVLLVDDEETIKKLIFTRR